MCYYGEQATIYEETWRKARVSHQCYGCNKGIRPGDRYVAVNSLYDGSWQNWNECERCRYYMALLYAEERADGCMPHESWCPVTEIYQDMHDRGWILPQEDADTAA